MQEICSEHRSLFSEEIVLDFPAYAAKITTFDELIAGVELADLARLTNEMVDEMLALISNCRDEDVTFVPADPAANDPYAASEDEVDDAWTLGHVIVHTTASAEEAAALAAEMARGVANHGRSRAEVPWETVTTVEHCRLRLEESRHIRLASLDMWPNEPDLVYRYRPWSAAPEINAIGRFIFGLRHDADHLGQIADVVEQAKSER